MNRALVLWFILISSSPIIHGYYNPIPMGCVIVSTTTYVRILQPQEYGGNDGLTVIFSAVNGTTIVTTIYDPTPRNLYVLYTNAAANGTIYLSQLIAREQLSATVYQLPVSADISYINQLISFTADVSNNRAFLTDENGTITMFSMSGLMKTTINTPANVSAPIRSVVYNTKLNRLFSITDNTLYSCTNLEANQLVCCSASAAFTALRSVAFDATASDSFVYVMDRSTGVYRMALDAAGCPQSAGPVSSVAPSPCIQLVVDQNIFFYSSSVVAGNDNSYLVIGDQTQKTRKVPIQESIIALHVSYPNRGAVGPVTETCFNGIGYSDYRLAVVLAALFGTIMGIFMCFNALFCIDFFMTKRIIRSLKQQIPHNLLEDRWNKLVEEKYAKLALESKNPFGLFSHVDDHSSCLLRGTKEGRSSPGTQT